jgi:serine protease Do
MQAFARTSLAAVALVIASAGCKRLESRDELPAGAVPVAPSAVAPPPVQVPVATSPAPFPQAGAPVSFAPIAHKADPGVVLVSTVEATEEPSPFFFGQARVRESKGLGTGFLIDKDGTILTNNHVVSGADEITVTLNDERQFPAKVVGVDPPTDVAVIRISATNLTPLALGDSDAIDVGDWAVAIGNPFALSHTVSAGIISAKGRTTQDVHLDPAGYYNFLQTDASINPGNSGGPLLNMRGEVIGINSAINPQANTIGFAIPINMVKQLLPALLRDGHVTRSALGVSIFPVRELSAEIRSKLQVKDEHGLVIMQVVPNGAAEAAGLQQGDVILAFDGETIDQRERLRWLASVAGVGRQVTLRVERTGKVFDQKVTLGLQDAPRGVATGRGRGGP